MVSMYAPEKPFPVYCSPCWWGDKWDPMQYGVEYDFSKNFFLQFKGLFDKVPRPNLRATNAVNSDYCNYVADVKNSYLCFGSIEIEDCLYGSPYESKYCVDTYLARESEYCYQCLDCEKLSSSSFCQDCANSLNLLYCFDCKGCQECIGSVGLRNKKYHIFNQEFSKEEYQKRKDEIFKRGLSAFEEVHGQFEKLKQTVPYRFATTLQCDDVSGDHIVQSKNTHESFDVKRTHDCSYCMRMIDAKDTHDTNFCEYLELCYDYLGFWKMTRGKFSNTCGECSDVEYADFCSSSSNLFGCIGLKAKSYCIFNKEYSKEEYKILIGKIKKQMSEMPFVDKKGRSHGYGEYFPIELAVFAYNESTAQDYFPLTCEQALAMGFSWKEQEQKTHKPTIGKNAIPERAALVSDEIINEILECGHTGSACNHQCTTAFKIIPQELQFYKRMNLPLPRLCPNCRHYERLAMRNPFKLWDRNCAKCSQPIKTSYAPTRPEIVYCESCYQKEVI